jgi:DNA helicase-2/ATP-dependent DNA helicase PcrA
LFDTNCGIELKKIILKKQSYEASPNRIGYKINYERELNPAQFEAVMHYKGPALVIAGAGTGKTRTLIYRLSRLVEDGIPPESIVLLTFTRKSSSEMMRRAALMLDGRCEHVSGGTFHSFSLYILRRWANLIGYENNFTMLDSGDSEDTVNLLRSQLKLDKSKKRFPKKATLLKIFNLVINKCQTVEEIVTSQFPFFLDEIEKINILFEQYSDYKRKYNLMDYDDLLLNLLKLVREQEQVRKELHAKYKYYLVDEYQDTNRLQHEIVLQLAGPDRNIMAVGDDAQSIYSFRGAEYNNIMTFPNDFDDCKIYKIEENYRSIQPILNLTNKIIDTATYKYEKELYSHRESDDKPKIICADNERQQSLFIAQQILDLREENYQLEDIAVLFRSGFHSFDLEIELNKANIPYMKFGGMKFIETAHIKDMMSFFKILANPKDVISWHRLMLMLDGVGPRTASKMVELISSPDFNLKEDIKLNYTPKGKDAVSRLMDFIRDIKDAKMSISDKANMISDFYRPLLSAKYDDWQKRMKDIETFVTISERYTNINDLLNEMALEPPTESVVDIEAESKEDEYLTLSTIHSAKGLEWRIIFIIWALDGRFPSSKAADSAESLEEERRLFYVACTRAKDQLYISYPMNVYDRESGMVLSKPSRFLDGLDDALADYFALQELDTPEN